MKLKLSVLLLFVAIVALSSFPSCKKDDVTTITKTDTLIVNDTLTVKDTITTYPIQGLWVGTYVVTPNSPIDVGESFYFSFSVYPDGTCSYKSKGDSLGNKNYITYANGTWALTGHAFSFSVTTVNYYTGVQVVQSGAAVYDSVGGTLSYGNIFQDGIQGATWSMNKIN